MRPLPGNARPARARRDCSPGIARCATPRFTLFPTQKPRPSVAVMEIRVRRGTERFYGAGGEEMATSSLHLIDGVPAMPQPNDLNRSLVALDQNSTIIAVVELSQSSWLVGGMLPGIERQPCVAPAMQHGKQPFWARL